MNVQSAGVWVVFFAAIGCTSTPDNGGVGTDAGASVDAGSVDLVAPCAAHCNAIRRQCGTAPASCEADCECREATRPNCRAAEAAYVACASRAVLACPGGEAAVLCRDERSAYDACRAGAETAPNATCTPSGGGAPDASTGTDVPPTVDVPVADIPPAQDVVCATRCDFNEDCTCASTPPGQYRCCFAIPGVGYRCGPGGTTPCR